MCTLPNPYDQIQLRRAAQRPSWFTEHDHLISQREADSAGTWPPPASSSLWAHASDSAGTMPGGAPEDWEGALYAILLLGVILLVIIII